MYLKRIGKGNICNYLKKIIDLFEIEFFFFIFEVINIDELVFLKSKLIKEWSWKEWNR